MFFVAVGVKLFITELGISWGAIVAVVLLFWFLVLQNLYYSMLIANRQYISGSALQVIGVSLRAALTVIAMYVFSATLDVFIYTQLVTTIIHWWVSRLILIKDLSDTSLGVQKADWPSFF
ncbi:hypothetical protein JNO13_23830 [Pseudomonas sp. 1079]|nr:hypothetical protein [Pseudomonas sp. 1079]MBN1083299.1 hypothetical protein [Pseudomonas sp. 1079]